MEIIKASLAGFCFGVKRAVDMVNEILENKSGKVYTLGHLIHNPVFNSELENRGVKNITPDKIDEIFNLAENGENIAVVIRTHGTTNDISEKLKYLASKCDKFTVYDCTCPKVKKIHEIVKKESEKDNLTIIFGSPEHPEVLGIKSYAQGEAFVIENKEELEKLLPIEKEVILVSQTTQKLSEWKKCREIVEKVCTKAQIFDTICGVTEKRQEEVYSLAKNADVMLVIGGRESSNTTKLYQISRNICEKTYFIETTSDIPKEYSGRNIKIGIAAGASTPDDIIGEVISIMSEEEIKKGEDTAKGEFANMLDDFGPIKTVRTGENVSGIISSIGTTEVTVDLNTNVTGMLPTEELGTPEEIAENFHVGDTIDATVTKVSDAEGVATLSRKRIVNIANWSNIKDAYLTKSILEGKVSDVVKGGIIVNVKGTRVFIPASQSGIPRGGDLNTLIGTVQRFSIIDIDEKNYRAVGSIRAAKAEERREKREKFWAEAEVGKEYDGEVRSLTSYGAFVDLGGVDGMVHVSELSWSHIKNPAEVVKVGDKIHVFIKEIDPEKKRISLGYKRDEDNPWTIFEEKYAVGDVVNVTVQGLTSFGAFAEIIPGIDGLIHISQISTNKIEKPSDVLKKGDKVDAQITAIDFDAKRVSLSMRALIDEAAAAEEAKIKEEAGDLLITEDDATDEPEEETPAADAPVEDSAAEETTEE